METKRNDLTPLFAAVLALREQAGHAIDGGDWSAAGALLEDAGYLCQMIGRRQEKSPKQKRKPKEKTA